MTAQPVTDALMTAIWHRGKPDALLHHSDQGSQFASEQFQWLMTDNGGQASESTWACAGRVRHVVSQRWRCGCGDSAT